MSRYIDIEPILEWCDDPDVIEPYGIRGSALYRKIRYAPTIKTKEIKYYDDDDHVWKIGRVIVDE